MLTFELKNSLTQQTVEDAIEQYQRDRERSTAIRGCVDCLVALPDQLSYRTQIPVSFGSGKRMARSVLRSMPVWAMVNHHSAW